MRTGFTLIEFMLVFAIAAFLLTMLFGALLQSNKLVYAADEYIDRYTALTIAYHQFHKDISGACVPLQVYFDETLKKEKADPKIQALTKDIQSLEKVFVLETQNTQLRLLTFISNNPPHAYWSELIGSATPALVRVVYRLQPDNETERPSFTLLRQSGTDLDFKEYATGGSIREYTLLSNIKEASVSCTQLIQEGDGEQVTKTVETKTEWYSDSFSTEEKKSIRYIPNGVALKLVMWDTIQQTSDTYVMTFVIRADSRIVYTQPTPPPPIQERKKSKSMVQLSSEVPEQESP
jgi:type II secretory pathway pseudopilin PulG